jgi:microcystin-dependent protein
MGTPYLGQVSMFGGTYAPTGWAFCNGQLLPISQNTALYSLLGTAYGGDGVQTFGLPNLMSRLPIHVGQGGALSPYALGQNGGAPEVTITSQTMPNHGHTLNATTANASTGTVGNTVIPATVTGPNSPLFYAAPATNFPPPAPVQMAAGACGPAGNSLPHNNMMPSLCITFIIALAGAYPSRS